jgi:pyridoxamine 5'-phosphate oxidase
MMEMDLAAIRNDYKLKVLDESLVSHNPLLQFEVWLNEAIETKANEPTAMVLATATPTGIPSARIVLLKALSDVGFVFFTSYSSRKGQEIAVNPHIALLFHWRELERQVRIEGTVVKTSSRISDEYFQSRPFESRLSAVISNQSQVVPNREYLEKLWEGQHLKSIGSMIERPSDWGGYLVDPERIEFWQGRPNRLHDRVLYSKKGVGWAISRLAP